MAIFSGLYITDDCLLKQPFIFNKSSKYYQNVHTNYIIRYGYNILFFGTIYYLVCTRYYLWVKKKIF